MIIETNRLKLIPLTAEQLELWLNNLPALEKELHCRYAAEPMQGIFKEIVKGQLEITKSDCKNYVWHSFWFIIRISDNTVVGSADFKDVPNDNGEVEIGYGLGKEFEKNGYMAEAVTAMCNWAAEQTGVIHIIAETELDGFASQRILQKCGFKEYKKDSTAWWRL